jgi:hypothetical protein
MRIVIKDIMKVCKCSDKVALNIEEQMEIEGFDFSQATKKEFRIAAKFAMMEI